MNMKISKEIKLALLGIVAIVLFIFGFNFLKGSGLFSSTNTIYAEYDDVQGVTASSFVMLQGFNIGSVSNVYLSKKNKGKVIVEMNIDKSIPIPTDSKAKIITADLLGTKAVVIEKGKSATLCEHKHTLSGTVELGMFDKLGESAGPTIDNANNAISSLDTTIKSINQILDVQTQQNLKSSIANLNSTMQEMKLFASEINAQRNKISSIITSLNQFSANLNNNNSTINKLIANTEKTTESLSKVDIQSTVSELTSTLEQLKSTLDKVNNGSGSMAMLMNDDKLYKNLKNTIATTNNLLYDLSVHPKKYVHFSVFGRKNKAEAAPLQAPNANE